MNPFIRLAALAICICLQQSASQAHEPVVVAEVEDSALGPLRIRLDGATDAPYRAFVLSDPPRLIVDLAGAHLEDGEAISSPRISGVRIAPFDLEWMRMSVTLARPMVLQAVVPNGAQLTLVLRPSSEAEMIEAATLAPRMSAPKVVLPLREAATAGVPLIVIDPGHGGVDPGARRGGVAEKTVTLAVSELLAQRLQNTGRYHAVLTRDDDRFVLLDDRVSLARAAGAELFISIHANTVEIGQATGATVHTPSDGASDPESAALAVFENRSDTLGEAVRHLASDDVELALNAMLEPVTRTRAKAAAHEVVTAFRNAGLRLHRRPLRAADFRVLRAPDMPSILVELGFLSSPEERRRLTDPIWQGRVADAMVHAIDAWIAADQDFLSLMRE